MALRLRIVHVTGFTYEGQSHASYNETRLTPMTLPWQVTLFAQVEVHPPASTYRYYDYWGTLVTAFDLQRQHGELKVVASSLVETEEPPPVAPVGWPALAAAADQHAELLASTPRTTISSELVSMAAGLGGSSAEPASSGVALTFTSYAPSARR